MAVGNTYIYICLYISLYKYTYTYIYMYIYVYICIKNDNCMGLKSSKLQRFIRKRGPRKDSREESLKKSSITGVSDQQLRIRLRKKTKPESIHPDVTQNQQQKKRKLTSAQSQHRPPEKRGLPVAWGSDIFKKCPRLLDQFSKFPLATRAGAIGS